MQSSNRALFIGIVFAGLLYGTFGHSYVTSPTSRSDQQQTETGCRGPACFGPCDVPLASKTRAAIATQRGASLNIQWPRNNHAGGFIRFAWAPTAQSDSMAVFDANVQQINCHEIGGCAPGDPSNPNGGDSNGAAGLVNPCQTTIRVPSSLTDGAWTLQWGWFGGAFALGDYFSCVDYQVSGGVAATSAAPAIYVGGDYTYPGQNKCKFFNTDKIHECIDEPCNNPIYPLSQEESGPAAGFTASSGSNSGSSSSSSTSTSAKGSSTSTSAKGSSTSSSTSSTSTSAKGSTSSKGTSTSTSGKSSTSTSGKSSTSTSGKASTSTSGKGSSTSTSGKGSSTSGKGSTSTSGHAHGSGDSSSSSSSSGSSNGQPPSGACATGHMMCLTSESFSTCAHELWGVSQSCAQGTTCSPSGDYIYCV